MTPDGYGENGEMTLKDEGYYDGQIAGEYTTWAIVEAYIKQEGYDTTQLLVLCKKKKSELEQSMLDALPEVVK